MAWVKLGVRVLVFFIVLLGAADADADERRSLLPVPAVDVPLNSTEGVALLRDATHPAPFYQLSIHFETQRNQAFCSAATAVIMLNALSGSGSGSGGVASPTDGMYAPYPYFTQRALFDDTCVNSVETHEVGTKLSAKFLANHGATLHEWQTYLKCFVGEAGVKHVHASTADADAFRRDVIAAFTPSSSTTTTTTTPTAYVGINFHRTEIGELGGGHMSPIGAYDAASDKVLVMDVSRYKYPPVWTPLMSVYSAMNTTDSASGKSRGWVVISGGGGGGAAEATPAAEVSPDEVARRREARKTCMSVAGDSDWDAVMGCMRWPPVVLSATGAAAAGGGGGGNSEGKEVEQVPVVSAVLTALVCSILSGAGVGGAWWCVEKQREAKFRKHVVMEGDFEDI